MNICLCVPHTCLLPMGGQKRVLDPKTRNKDGFEQMWLMGTKPGPSSKATSALDLWSFSPTPILRSF